MQRPRRTSEFQEEPGTAVKRQLRNSRRPASLDRASIAGTLPLIARPSTAASSALRGRGTTPQRTPVHGSATKVLFTAEKQRGQADNKKWLYEQAQRIVDYLAVTGVGAEIFVKGSGAVDLRQMTIKQFVAIVNHFLKCICSNRFTVNGTNHVEDICTIMQKLQYPHQLNKSWLKTPTTPHSFCHVLTMLEFLRECAPSPSDNTESVYHELPHAQEGCIQSPTGEQQFQLPDDDFHLLMLQHAEEGFKLWDKQKIERFTELQQQTADVLIQKRCGASGCIALDAELQHLQQKLADVENRGERVAKPDEAHCAQLEMENRHTLEQIANVKAALHEGNRELKQLKKLYEQNTKKVAQMEQALVEIKASVSGQSCSAAQRDKLVEEIGHLKIVLQCRKGTLNGLQDKYHHQQVLLSRAKLNFTNQVESFNGYLRKLATSLKETSIGKYNLEDHQLPQNPKPAELQSVITTLKQRDKELKQSNLENNKRQQRLDRHIAGIEHELEAILNPKLLAQEAELAQVQKQQSQLGQEIQLKRNETNERLDKLHKKTQADNVELQNWKEIVQQKQWQLQSIEEDNEESLAEFEQEYYTWSERREKFLADYETVLLEFEKNVDELEQLK